MTEAGSGLLARGRIRIEPEAVARFARAVEASDASRPGSGPAAVPPTFPITLLVPGGGELDALPLPFALEGAIHAEQRFEFSRPLDVGEEVAVETRLVSLRRRPGSTGMAVLGSEGRVGETVVYRSRLTLLLPEAGGRLGGRGPGRDPDLAAEGGRRVVLDRRRVMRYACAAGDFNPIHYDGEVARRFGLKGPIVHGMLLMGVAAGMLQPGETAALAALTARFRVPVPVGSEVETVRVETDPGLLTLGLRMAGAEDWALLAEARFRTGPAREEDTRGA